MHIGIPYFLASVYYYCDTTLKAYLILTELFSRIVLNTINDQLVILQTIKFVNPQHACAARVTVRLSVTTFSTTTCKETTKQRYQLFIVTLEWCPDPSQNICRRVNACTSEGEKGLVNNYASLTGQGISATTFLEWLRLHPTLI